MRVYLAGIIAVNERGTRADIIEVLANIRRGVSITTYLINHGYDVYCPMLDFQLGLIGQQPPTEDAYKRNSMAWLEVSEAVVVISGAGLHSGVDKEIVRARELGIPVYFSTQEFLINREGKYL